MGWQLLIDRGGTFTDVVARAPDGTLSVRKLLSRSVDGRDAVAQAVASAGVVDELRLGTTVATNALLERRGERVLLLTTAGFGDLLAIGSQERPDLFALQIEKRALLHAAVVEVDERILADGRVDRPLDPGPIAAAVAGFEHVAVLFLNSYVNPAHELLAEQALRAAGVSHVTLSHRTSALPGAVARGDTTVADAYLTPVLRRSVEHLDVGAGRVLCMQSSGGLTDRARFSGKDAILSGPAGGVVAAAHVAAAAGFPRVIGLDMGGTSTDVCRCDGGQPERSFESVTAGVRVRAPMLDILTVAAGGGSVLSAADGRFAVGPESAGADPGPACYGRGGPATVTDANVVLGRIRADAFPHLALDVDAARARLAAFGDPEEAARGFLRIAVENMAAAIRRISVARGHDPRDYALCCFGGAAGQHACALATSLGMTDVVLHPLAGVLSAWGMGLADVSHHEVRPVLDPSTTAPDFPDEEAAAVVRAQGLTEIELLRSVDVRYAGVETTLSAPWGPDWRERFEQQHLRAFGFVQPGHPVELVAARVDALGRAQRWEDDVEPELAHEPVPLAGDHAMPVFQRRTLRPGARIDGPALIVEDNATTVVEAGWRARVDGRRLLLLHHVGAASGTTGPTLGTQRDPVTLEVMANLFMSIATQMGEHLRRVAHSTNIKERLDYSCALFDARGGLVANAPHIPVHLGAMGETVRSLLGERELRPGDAWLSNDPYKGGSHLPDLTVVTPVFHDDRLVALTANRGHHADVGGSEPGSMPPDSRSLLEEGALFSNELLLRDGELQTPAVSAIFQAAGTRDLEARLADLRAQVACNLAGARLVEAFCERHGADVLAAWMGHVEDNAAEVMTEVVAGLSDGHFADELDDGSRIEVDVSIRDGRARIDFAGTSPQHPGNRNAPRAVAVAATLYVFRTLAARPIPLNAGCLRPLEIVIPEGSMLDPAYPAAVVGGNVETSQRIVDVLYGALGKLAACQGTMNNVTFGDESFGYYETVCGGAGAGFGFDGASAVHTHMTNTRITDPEILERRHPVVVRRFAIRTGSGGSGVWRGGDGVVRELQFLRPLRTAVLAERRVTAPFGLRAGAGALGEQVVTEHGLVLRTPGGGGYSPSAEQWAAMSPTEARQLFREGRWTGTTDGVASDHPQAWLVAVAARDADRAVDALREHGELIHRSKPGETAFGDADLATDLPLYAQREPSVGDAPGEITATSGALSVCAETVLLLVRVWAPASPAAGPMLAASDDDLPALGMPHSSGAPGRRFVG